MSLWSLPFSSVLAILSLILRMHVVLPSEDFADWAQTVVSSKHMITQHLYIVAYAIAFYGFWALYMFLMQRILNEWRLIGEV